MRARDWACCIALGTLVIPQPAKASNARIVNVKQVIYGVELGSRSAMVPYLRYWDSGSNPGGRVLLTVEPNSMSSPDGQFQNRNAASLLGARIQVLQEDGRRRTGLRGDTLSVLLDLGDIEEGSYRMNPGYGPARFGRMYWAEHIVPDLVECMKWNAAASAPQVRYLAVDVSGDARFESLSGVYDLSELVERE